MTPAGDLCGKCHHDFDGHSVIALATTKEDVLDGGIILCPVPGCQCYSTWAPSINGEPSEPPPAEKLPNRWQVEALRERLQRGQL